MPKIGYKEDFPVFENEEALVYLDSAASTLRPKQVVKAMQEYSSNQHANIHRGAYKLSYEATKSFDSVREKVKKFIGAKFVEEIIFTYGTTDGINSLMRSFLDQQIISKEDHIVISIFEHHSNIVPWQQLCSKTGATLDYLYDFSEESLNRITKNTKVVSVTLMSNATGFIPPIRKVIAKAREVGAVIIVDGAQFVGHEPIDVVDLDVDYLVFSAHKMFGPTGVGVLYGKKKLLEKLPSFRFGGDMIEYVTEQSSSFAEVPTRFEAGTPNIDGVIGLGSAIDYIESIGIETINEYLNELRNYAYEKIKNLDYISVIDFDGIMGPVISFNVKDVHPHDVASILDASGIALRSGHHCAQPLMKHLDCLATCRISFQIYNTKKDIDYLVDKLGEVRRWLGYES